MSDKSDREIDQHMKSSYLQDKQTNDYFRNNYETKQSFEIKATTNINHQEWLQVHRIYVFSEMAF